MAWLCPALACVNGLRRPFHGEWRTALKAILQTLGGGLVFSVDFPCRLLQLRSLQPREKEIRLQNQNIGAALLSPQDHAITCMIRSRVARGESLERIARTSRISYIRLRRLAQLSQIRYKHKRPSKDQIRSAVAAVRDQGATFRAAAAQFGMSKTAVHRYVSARRRKSIDSAGDVRFEEGSREYSRHKRSWNCPTHGRVVVWPCVACAALAAKGAK